MFFVAVDSGEAAHLPIKLTCMIFMDVPSEGLPKFGALPPIKRPCMFFVAVDSGEAAHLPIKLTCMIFMDVPPDQ
jgi:hypothetical protein